MHDRLFGAGAQLDATGLRALAEDLHLDASAFESCLVDEATRARVTRDGEQARNLGLVSTPSFLVGSLRSDGGVKVLRAFSGALPLEEFRKEFDRALGQ
jgi:protein-disulfide isomerase